MKIQGTILNISRSVGFNGEPIVRVTFDLRSPTATLRAMDNKLMINLKPEVAEQYTVNSVVEFDLQVVK